MAAVDLAPSELDADPTAYLALPRFNHTLDFELHSQRNICTHLCPQNSVYVLRRKTVYRTEEERVRVILCGARREAEH
jgi:hypothetical protein